MSCIVNVVCCILAGHEDDSLLLLPCWIAIGLNFSRPLLFLHEGYLPCTNPSSPSSSSSISPDVCEPSTSPTCRVVISNSRDLPNAGCFLHDQKLSVPESGYKREAIHASQCINQSWVGTINPSGLPNMILFIPYITHHTAYKTSVQCIALQGQT